MNIPKHILDLMPPGPHMLFGLNRASYRARQQLEYTLDMLGVDITPDEAIALGLICKTGADSISDLADLLIRDRTTVTRMIESLEGKGYVTRSSSPTDRRSVLVHTTQKALDFESLMDEQVLVIYRKLFAGISKRDLIGLNNALKKIQANGQVHADFIK